MRHLLPLIGLVAVVLAGCDALTGSPDASPSPSPTTSPTATPTFDPAALDVAIVLAPPDAGPSAVHGHAVRAAAGALEGSDDPNVRRIRVADAPTEDLRGDVLAFLADDGADVVCTVGPRGGDHLVALAERHPRTTFCLLGGELDDELDNGFGIGLPQVETAFLAGAAAALAADGGPLGVVDVATDPVPGELADAFRAGVRHVRPPEGPDDEPDDEADGGGGEDGEDGVDETDATAESDDTDDADQPPAVREVTAIAGATAEEVRAATAESAAAAYREEGLAVLVAYGGPSAVTGLVEAARTAGGLVVGGWADVRAVVGEEAAEVTAVSVVTRFEAVLASALRRVETPDGPAGPVEVGDVLAVVPGGTADAEALAEEVRAILEELAGGRITVAPPDGGP